MPPGLLPSFLGHLLGGRSQPNAFDPYGLNPFGAGEIEGDDDTGRTHSGRNRTDGSGAPGSVPGGQDGAEGPSYRADGSSPSSTSFPTTTPSDAYDLPLAQVASLGAAVARTLQAALTPSSGNSTQPGSATTDGAGHSLGSSLASQAARSADTSIVRSFGAPSGGTVLGGTAAATVGTPAIAAVGTTQASQPAQQTVASQSPDRNSLLQAQLTTGRSLETNTLQTNLRNDAIALSDRNALLQTQQASLQQPAIPTMHGHTDIVQPALLPQLAGATVLAAPSQPIITPGQAIGNTQATAILPGSERAGSVASPQGHTVQAAFRRRFARNPQGMTNSLRWLSVLAERRDRSRRERTPAETGLQWVFWILAIVTYAAFAMAIVMLIPAGSRGVFDPVGRPTPGGLALFTGAATAVVAWGSARWLKKKLH